jgi:hypothetical protein
MIQKKQNVAYVSAKFGSFTALLEFFLGLCSFMCEVSWGGGGMVSFGKQEFNFVV